LGESGGGVGVGCLGCSCEEGSDAFSEDGVGVEGSEVVGASRGEVGRDVRGEGRVGRGGGRVGS